MKKIFFFLYFVKENVLVNYMKEIKETEATKKIVS